ISAGFPASDGVGYSREKVPEVSSCLPVPLDTFGTCVASMQEDYMAILLGDVNGNWRSADGVNLRSQTPEVVLQMEGMTLEDGIYSVPVSLTQTYTLESFDLVVRSVPGEIVVEELLLAVSGFNQVSNHREDQFLFSSFTLEKQQVEGLIGHLKVKTNGLPPQEDDIDGVQVYLNGSEVSTGVAHVLSSEEEQPAAWVAYPNPFTRSLTLQSSHSKGATEITLTNFAGQVVYHNVWENTGAGEIVLELPELAKGMYLLSIHSGTVDQMIKVIK
ncbi:MAG: T9SS type A sorting domain-containing protein, partial [Bacteroidota bacterium]